MDVPIGTCSLCGGDVIGWEGAWWSVLPPPPPHCASCGAVMASGPVIPMQPRPQRPITTGTLTTTNIPNSRWQLQAHSKSEYKRFIALGGEPVQMTSQTGISASKCFACGQEWWGDDAMDAIAAHHCAQSEALK